MTRSQHSLHHHVPLANPHEIASQQLLAALRRNGTAQAAEAAPPPASHAFPITTVSMKFNFDAYILVGFQGADPSQAIHLIVDSGNTSLIVPRWEDIAAIPGHEQTYQILGQATEPWGCPANIVKGPIELFDSNGDTFTVENCVFFACTGDSPSHQTRTANFGVGCIVPWSASPPNVITSMGITLQPILSQTAYPYIEFDYAPFIPAEAAGEASTAAHDSQIKIHSVMPDGYTMFDIVRGCQWMSLLPIGLSIAGSPTAWPGTAAPTIAMIDTGGGPVFLSDPDGYICSKQWPQPVANPAWASDSPMVQSIQAAVGITLGDGSTTYSYVIDDSSFPAADQGITLVMSQHNAFMMGRQGMNVGGISALTNAILIDYAHGMVGFRKK